MVAVSVIRVFFGGPGSWPDAGQGIGKVKVSGLAGCLEYSAMSMGKAQNKGVMTHDDCLLFHVTAQK